MPVETVPDIRFPSGESEMLAGDAARVARRPFPYPYRAALAICSDLDLTPDATAYLEMMRYLNSTAATRLGRGVGLEVGNSIYFDMPAGQFSYWTTDDRGRAMVQACIRSGHIDCLHSFGDLASGRPDAARALDELAQHGCALKIWVDHAVAPSNFGGDIMRGSGDVIGSAAYHADLSCAYGIEYVWRGRVTSVVGQNVVRRLSGIGSRSHPIDSGVTILKESAKGVLARLGSTKYAPHSTNQLVWPSRLRSGQPVFEFMRSNPCWGGVSRHETADGIGEVLTESMLRLLVEREGACILYTHLGKISRPHEPLSEQSRAGLERLAAAASTGQMLVTTTRRLLDFCRASREVVWSTAAGPDGAVIRIATRRQAGVAGSREVAGLAFYVDDASRASVFVDGQQVVRLQRNPPDHTGRASVSIPWPRLVFPEGEV
jgi:hypothetical protein